MEFFRGIGDLVHHTTPAKVPPARRMILLIIVGTLPLFLVLPLKDKVESLSDNIYFIGCALLFTGSMLWFCDHVKPGRKTEKNARLLDVLAVGVAQGVATCPGISRSGMTITSGCFMGFERRFAVRYSFLMSIPAILGANLLTLLDVMDEGVNLGEVPVYLAGVVTAAVVGYACIRLLHYIADHNRFGLFAWYCWGVGAAVLVTALLR